jgi:hypothetical protein
MPWRTAEVLERPTRTLDAWMAVEVPFDGLDLPWTMHLVGWRVEGGRGQVSSPVEVLDPRRRLARTRSGRVYELRHGPGLNGDAFTTWCQWKARHGLREELEVVSTWPPLSPLVRRRASARVRS